ncbi:hypothetical protein EJB05_14394 [Eragrostis curvula]|uniref:Uncharacterized protein n=1 Tax=Eragrostis curvula TaxID=38414 RepID=A0A5J9W0L7_9POAL|nr:hypothetical protein EJB05_14394 [Eragrostis curvula]
MVQIVKWKREGHKDPRKEIVHPAALQCERRATSSYINKFSATDEITAWHSRLIYSVSKKGDRTSTLDDDDDDGSHHFDIKLQKINHISVALQDDSSDRLNMVDTST